MSVEMVKSSFGMSILYIPSAMNVATSRGRILLVALHLNFDMYLIWTSPFCGRLRWLLSGLLCSGSGTTSDITIRLHVLRLDGGNPAPPDFDTAPVSRVQGCGACNGNVPADYIASECNRCCDLTRPVGAATLTFNSRHYFGCEVVDRGLEVSKFGHGDTSPADASSIRMSSTRQQVVLGPSLTDAGNRCSLTPLHHELLETGMIAGIGGVAFGLPMI